MALAALRHADLHEVQPVGHDEVLRLLAKRNTDIGDRGTQVVCRMHALLVELAPGGISINTHSIGQLLPNESELLDADSQQLEVVAQSLVESDAA